MEKRSGEVIGFVLHIGFVSHNGGCRRLSAARGRQETGDPRNWVRFAQFGVGKPARRQRYGGGMKIGFVSRNAGWESRRDASGTGVVWKLGLFRIFWLFAVGFWQLGC